MLGTALNCIQYGSQLISFEKKITVRWIDDSKGRGLVALEPIPADSVIFIERPFLVTSNVDSRQFCDRCGGLVPEIPVTCRCTMEVYCSAVCANDSKHSHLCPSLNQTIWQQDPIRKVGLKLFQAVPFRLSALSRQFLTPRIRLTTKTKDFVEHELCIVRL